MNTFLGAFKSKTMWFSVLLVLFGALVDYSTHLKDLIPPEYFSIVMVLIGVVIALLRLATTQPLNQK
jgi:hypothetical protein